MPIKRLIATAVSAAIIAALLWRVDITALLATFQATRWIIFVVAIALFVPQIWVIAWRWKRLVQPFTALPLTESVRLVLAGASMNLLLPGKLGDLTKGWFLARDGRVSMPLGLGVVVFEKMLDVAALAVFMLLGVASLLLGYPERPLHLPPISILIAGGLGLGAVTAVAVLFFVPFKWPQRQVEAVDQADDESGRAKRIWFKVLKLIESSHQTMAVLQKRGSRRGEIIGLSLLIWVLHLLQIYLFFLSVNAVPAVGDFLCMVPLAIFVGLIPVTLAGFGARDAALVALLPLPETAVLAASFYVNLRYILPALAGLPFLAEYSLRKRPPVPDE